MRASFFKVGIIRQILLYKNPKHPHTLTEGQISSDFSFQDLFILSEFLELFFQARERRLDLCVDRLQLRRLHDKLTGITQSRKF